MVVFVINGKKSVSLCQCSLWSVWGLEEVIIASNDIVMDVIADNNDW